MVRYLYQRITSRQEFHQDARGVRVPGVPHPCAHTDNMAELKLLSQHSKAREIKQLPGYPRLKPAYILKINIGSGLPVGELQCRVPKEWLAVDAASP